MVSTGSYLNSRTYCFLSYCIFCFMKKEAINNSETALKIHSCCCYGYPKTDLESPLLPCIKKTTEFLAEAVTEPLAKW